MADVRTHYREQRELGVPKERALTNALVEAVKDDERRQLENGIAYTTDQARQATVHARQDIVILISQVTMLRKTVQRVGFWAVIVLMLIVLTLWFR